MKDIYWGTRTLMPIRRRCCRPMCIPFHEVNLSVTIEFWVERGIRTLKCFHLRDFADRPLTIRTSRHISIQQNVKEQYCGRRGTRTPSLNKRADFNANMRPSTSLPCNLLFRYPVYALYTFMKFNLQLSSALFIIYRPTTFTELAGFSSNRFQFELHYHHFFYSPRGYQLPVTLPF